MAWAFSRASSGVLASFAAAAGVHLRLDHDGAAQAPRDRFGLLGRRGHLAHGDRDPLRGEQVFRLVFVDVHGKSLLPG
jgi:hypothetical protein